MHQEVCPALFSTAFCPAYFHTRGPQKLQKDKTSLRQGMLSHIVPLFITCQTLSSPLPGRYISWCRVLWVIQICFSHEFWVRQTSNWYVFPAAVAMLCNTAALTPSDHSWHISLSWIGEIQSKWQVSSMQLLERTYGDYYEGAVKTSLESACGADNREIAFFDNF